MHKKELAFAKYHGTGNDFVIMDNREGQVALSKEDIASICTRRYGVGADGLMLLQNHSTYDFEMVYFNSDGGRSTMCGNGGRCLAHYAHQIGAAAKDMTFMAVDGLHHAKILSDDMVSLSMNDVQSIEELGDGRFFLNTGSPHVVVMASAFPDHFVEFARSIRYAPPFKEEGVNVNVLVGEESGWRCRTYERGVEDETQSCGTGAVACALTADYTHPTTSKIALSTLGGQLTVSATKKSAGWQNIILEGEVTHVLQGKLFI